MESRHLSEKKCVFIDNEKDFISGKSAMMSISPFLILAMVSIFIIMSGDEYLLHPLMSGYNVGALLLCFSTIISTSIMLRHIMIKKDFENSKAASEWGLARVTKVDNIFVVSNNYKLLRLRFKSVHNINPEDFFEGSFFAKISNELVSDIDNKNIYFLKSSRFRRCFIKIS